MDKFDISALSYKEFLDFVFAAPENEMPKLDLNGKECWMITINRPEVVVEYLTRLCTGFRELAETMPMEKLDTGIDELLNPSSLELQKVLWHKEVPLQKRIDCIRSMYRVFADFVAGRELGKSEGCFYMWWDFVCWGFWFDQTYHKKLPTKGYDLLDEQDRKLVDAMFETLVEILKLEGNGARGAALHGLGHVHHPGARAVVQEFIDKHLSELDAKEISWLEHCRDGTNM